MSLAIGGNQKKKTINLYDCLDSFFSDETLGDFYYCDFCKKKQRATKSIAISKPPKILLIHLKRFKLFPKKRIKITDSIDFPFQKLNISKYCTNQSTQSYYNFKAAALHSGNVDYGHYRAVGMRANNWVIFDDEKVKKISLKSIPKNEVYLLFFEKVV